MNTPHEHNLEPLMNAALTLKTLVVLALVAATTALIVQAEHGAAAMPLQHQTVLN